MFYLCFILMYTIIYPSVLSQFIKITPTRNNGFKKRITKPVTKKIKVV